MLSVRGGVGIADRLTQSLKMALSKSKHVAMFCQIFVQLYFY